MLESSQNMSSSPFTPLSTLRAFEVSVQSGEMAVREALDRLMQGLEPLALEIEETSTVEIVLAEALNNIVEHAYPENHPDGPIHIACAHRANGLHLTIRDQGHAMPDGQLPIGLVPRHDVSVADLPEGGFGWFLIKDLAKDVEYHRAGGENQLKLRLAIGMTLHH